MEEQGKPYPSGVSKKILVASPGGVSGGKQFVVTQSKGTTIIQPAVVHGTTSSAQQQYIVTGMSVGVVFLLSEKTTSNVIACQFYSLLS